jgi:hypothetical protein
LGQKKDFPYPKNNYNYEKNIVHEPNSHNTASTP